MKLINTWDMYSKLEIYAVQLLRTFTSASHLSELLLLKLRYIKEDLTHTEESFVAKDAVSSKKLLKATMKYSEKYYRARLYEIYDLIKNISIANHQPIPDILLHLGIKLQIGIHASFHASEGFKNPCPNYLFFSQAKHAGYFSNKAMRDGVSSEPLIHVAAKLKSGELSADYLRVDSYLAPFKGELHPFVYNNRTWVAFSRSGVEASRIVPKMATQDLLNRIAKLDQSIYPNVILDEDAPVGTRPEMLITTSAKPGPRL